MPTIIYAPAHLVEAPTWKRRGEGSLPPGGELTSGREGAHNRSGELEASAPRVPATRATGSTTISELVEDPFQCPEIPAVSVQKEVVRSIPLEQGTPHSEQEKGTDPPLRHKNPHPQVPHLNVELINPLWEFPATVPRREITIPSVEPAPNPT